MQIVVRAQDLDQRGAMPAGACAAFSARGSTSHSRPPATSLLTPADVSIEERVADGDQDQRSLPVAPLTLDEGWWIERREIRPVMLAGCGDYERGGFDPPLRERILVPSDGTAGLVVAAVGRPRAARSVSAGRCSSVCVEQVGAKFEAGAASGWVVLDAPLPIPADWAVTQHRIWLRWASSYRHWLASSPFGR